MPATHAYEAVHDLALGQHGVFTTGQARRLGVDPKTLAAMAARGRVRRVSSALYQDRGAPETRWTEYMKAVLWPRGVVGVLSHETALDLMELSDANPSKIHITVPPEHRVRRRRPLPGVVLHRARLSREEIGSIEGMPVTKAARAIRDCAEAGLGPALLRQALDDGVHRGWLSQTEAARLRQELTGEGLL